MDERVNQQLSAAVDGELDTAEWQLLCRRTVEDDALRGHWSRYHLVGDTLRGHRQGPRADAGFAARVAAATAAAGQPVASAPRARWMRSAVGMGIAASVAAVALLTLRVDTVPMDEAGVVVPVTANPKVAGGVQYAAGPTVQWERARPEVQAQLNTLLLDHADGVEADTADALDDDE